MVRSRRSLAWSLVLALLCASFATMQRLPAVHAAANTYYVDTALDGNLASNPAACPNNETIPENKNCTLRQAIERANSDSGTSEIQFIIPADAVDPDNGYDSATQTWVIKPNSPLPALSSGGTTITGRNDNPAGTPRIVLDGTNVPSTNGVGITVSSASNIITQLIIINFKGTSNTSGIGVRITGAGATGNQVYGNYIGNRPNDTTAYPNRRAGIQIDGGATTNTIGLSSTPGQRNVISGNGATGSGGDGIVLQGAASNLIQGNYIGLGLGPGLTPVKLANAGYGIQIADGSGNTLGGAASTLRNIISGNGQAGVLLTGTGATGNQVTGNYIGTDVFGTSDLGNGEDGVQIVGGAKNNVVSSSAASRSVISGNAGYGVLISDDGTTGNQISGVFIGVSVGGGLNLPNDAGGVRIQNDAKTNVVGGASAGNVISGNTGYGVSLGRTTVGFTAIMSNTISGNFIGLNSAGTLAVPNTLGGVLIDNGSKGNRLGGSSTAERNVISGNSGLGVVISGTFTFSNTVTGNIIGLRSASVGGPFTTAGANSGGGVLVTNAAQYTRVGGTAAEANTIAGNTGNGVHVTGSGTNNTTIQSNYIGVAFSNNTYIALGNTQNGVLVDGSAQRAKIVDNHISRNSAKGIALAPQTLGPPGTASNANHDIDPPFNIHLNQVGRLTGRVYADGSNAACGATCTVQIFTADPAAQDRQGRDKVTPTAFQISANGYFTATLSGPLPQQLALTATDAAGNTSEFAVLTSTLGLAIGPARSSSAVPGQVINYTHRITNTGAIDFTNLRLSATSSRNWPLVLTPSATTDISLAAHESKTVTLTLTLPAGSDPRVRAGGEPDRTRVTIKSASLVTVTASVTDTTTVLPKFLLDATFKQGRKGNGAPNTVVDYTRTMTNTGNITGTVTLGAITDLGWTTIVTPTSVQLPPGKTIGVITSVKIPQGTSANTVAKTTLTLNGTADSGPPDPQQLVIIDTTTTLLTPKATMVPQEERDAGAGETVQLCATVTNLSNGPATFTLTGVSSLGSKIVFVSNMPGRPLVNGKTFTVGIGTDSLFNFCANVTVEIHAQKGQTDQISIGLTDDQGAVVGGASVRDIIHVVRNFMWRVYMPIILK